MVVGIVGPDGKPVSQFGSNGWATVRGSGQPTAVVLERSEEIVLGIQIGTDCCESQFLEAISATGKVSKSFGVAGRAVLPDAEWGPEGSSIKQIVQAGNDDLLVVDSGGHMVNWRAR
jgi:hypothetical protein